MTRQGRAFSIAGGVLGAAAAFALAKLAKPYLPVPSGGIGFLTVHRIPKAVDIVRFLLLLVFIPLGAVVASRIRRTNPRELRESVLTPGPSPQVVERGGRQAGVRKKNLSCLLMAVVFLAFRVFYATGIHGPVDLFHAGHFLSPAGDALAGKVFFRDALPFHGLLADGGLDAAAFRVFGETLSVARGLRVGLDLFFFAVACWVIVSLLRSPGRVFLGILLFAFLIAAFRLDSGFPFFRTVPLLLAAFFSARAAETGRNGFAAAAGAAAGFGIFWSLDTGLFAVAALLAWLALDSLSTRSPGRWRFAAAGVGLGALPGLVFLLFQGALGSFVRDSAAIVRSSDAIWSLPAPSAGDLFRSLRLGPIGFLSGEPLHFYLPIFLFGSIAAWLLRKKAGGMFGQRERTVLALLAFSVVAYRTALGRSSYSHTRFSMVVPSVLFAYFLATCGLDLRRLGVRARAAVALVAVLGAFYAEVPAACANAWAMARDAEPRWRGEELSAVALPRWGASRTVPAQGAALETLDRFCESRLRPGETFYDFSNAGALYFFLRRPNPTRVYEASCLSAGDFERDAISDLERARPGFVVVASPGQQDFDGIPNDVRAPKMAAWIRENYPREVTVGGFQVRVR